LEITEVSVATLPPKVLAENKVATAEVTVVTDPPSVSIVVDVAVAKVASGVVE
jgi:hypothetical protein